MLKILLKKQLSEIFRSYFYDAKKNKARSQTGHLRLYGVFCCAHGGGSGGTVSPIFPCPYARPLAEAGMGWLYFALMGLLAIFLGAVRQRVQYLFQSVPGQG